MMNYGFGQMMGGGTSGAIIGLVVLVDLVLLGVWLWKQVSK